MNQSTLNYPINYTAMVLIYPYYPCYLIPINLTPKKIIE